ncbi:MAG: thioredoxin [Prevotella sp.]|nr:thioredoxin [Prevotella sp.]MBO5204480.1 thioredoxin [Prevotella sp.]
MEVTITNENYKGYAEGELPLMIDFWATWCGPCRQMLPIVEELANEYDGKIVVGKCNVDEADDIAMQHGIRSIPTILFIKNGEVVYKSVGAVPKAKLVEKIEKVL